jgi:hypothetical protein
VSPAESTFDVAGTGLLVCRMSQIRKRNKQWGQAIEKGGSDENEYS